MLRWIAPAALGVLTAGAALAEPTAPNAPAGPGLFISPSGEPFRGASGLADWFAQADRDGDTLLTLAEFRLDAENHFRRLDSDGDGRIDGFENQAYERDVVPEITRLRLPGEGAGGASDRSAPERPKGPWFGRAAPSDRQGAARYGLLNIPQPVRNADSDLSGRVTWEEWGQAAERRFQTLDADGDGVLTLAALQAREPRP